MKHSLGVLMVMLGAVVAPPGVLAHCDLADGPVASAALNSLAAKNVNLVLPYVPAEAEAELIAVFDQALVVRGHSPDARALADRHFMETAVRLHRVGENATYTGLKPPGMDFGPAIPAAETALETGDLAGLLTFITREVIHGISERFTHIGGTTASTKERMERAQVPAARARVRTEFEFIGYIETLYRATRGGAGHPE